MKTTFLFSKDCWAHNNARLTNQIYKLLPMYEHEEDWKKQLNSLILEFKGYNEMFEDSQSFMVLISKLYALFHCEDHLDFRKLVFEAISLLKEISV